MKTLGLLVFSLLALFSSAAMAHHSPASMEHLVEHLLLMLAIGLPLFFGFRYLLKRNRRD
ncbi:MAG: hypothetical protein JAY97_20710 [Candidatus Thiodiazotropha sp. 'RUGA']|uniref:Uncharacterized protein n=1 Tax=Candidatus Thiodiazotropha taylori TaxID=2792791 RepID=A0A9E4P1B2_9GAMM|nr:hypothetical protein [Candidatus Thiodiazotropha taylori]MCG7963331.1 hypothetical protein [Candidatus Thiodiazotropha endolucinida]MCG8018634.1 hypothetical protein [Candidatus Thiodiazotropha sp. 'RUGA']RLW56377.1 MAG: hypothetical protein B6D76_00420 [gamma proteobacterium symbiont of Stewartia floridana]MCG7867208.1 hypothetical protein [Candidatus Thiodiazotropha taylori]